MRGQFPAPQHLQMGFGRGLPFWDLDGWSFPSMQHRTGNLQGCNSPFIHFPFPRAEKLGLPTTDSLSPWVKSLEVTEPFYLLHACRYKRETINHHSKHREGGKVHSLCWPGLQIKGNLVMRTHQMIINKQFSLSDLPATCGDISQGQEGLFCRNMECWPFQGPPVQLDGIWSPLCDWGRC